MSKKKGAPKKKVAKKESKKVVKKTTKKPEIIVGYKTVDTDMKAFHDGTFKYTVGKDHTVKVPANDHGAACGTGLHFAPNKEIAINFAKGYDNDYILLEVQSLKSDIVGQDGGKFRTKKLFVNKVLTEVNSCGPEWKKAAAEVATISGKLLVPNKNATPKKIKEAVEAIRKTHGRKKLEAYVIDNLYEANVAIENVGTDFHFTGGDKNYDVASKAMDAAGIQAAHHHLPIDNYVWEDGITNVLSGYLEAHTTRLGKMNQKEVAKIKPYFDLLTLGCLPIGFGSKQNFIIFKPNQKLKDMKVAF